ncbi:MAG: STAS domain-containing protein [Fibrobacter sp.]|nr:STAS domain-containing protein [Fibrobacter sp.]
MLIEKKVENAVMEIALDGRLDTMTAPQLETEIMGKLDGITDLRFDFVKLTYISSAGLRVLLTAQKIMNKQGRMIVQNVCPEIKDILEVTGFSDILTIV